MKNLQTEILEIQKKGLLSSSCVKNILETLACEDAFSQEVILELIRAENWKELNNRFYTKIQFGTGGMRGRTIAEKITKTERGNVKEENPPQFPSVGTALLNFFTLKPVMLALIAYLQEKKSTPKIAIAYDTRFFSKEFCDFCAKLGLENACFVFLFSEPASTPELSYLVRQKKLDAGIVITASHNPSHDNGFKVYFSDGGQAVETSINRLKKYLTKPAKLKKKEKGKIYFVKTEEEKEYQKVLKNLFLDFSLIQEEKPLRIVFSSLHGTGKRMILPLLKDLACEVHSVISQEVNDGGFSTVKSPNPENAEAFTQIIALANERKIDIGIATDPDCDRLGMVARNKNGKMDLLSGNQIGSLFLWYRLKTLSKQRKMPKNPIVIQTFVTSSLQEKIANSFGCEVVKTLTGFKYIGAKLAKYEKEKRETCFVFGAEESYGFLATSKVRDKDANGAGVMASELALFARREQKSIWDLLENIYQTYGYHSEKTFSLVFEGANGAEKRKKLFAFYQKNFLQLSGKEIVLINDFTQETKDVEGDILPFSEVLSFSLEKEISCVVRPSGTEPKMKYYLFASLEKGSSLAKREEMHLKLEKWQKLITQKAYQLLS